MLTKDHMYGMPIKKIQFHDQDQVISMDGQIVKIWDRQVGTPYTSIESTAEFNDLSLYPGSGLLFLANEQPKMQVHTQVKLVRATLIMFREFNTLELTFLLNLL